MQDQHVDPKKLIRFHLPRSAAVYDKKDHIVVHLVLTISHTNSGRNTPTTAGKSEAQSQCPGYFSIQ
jgi:hypothetical protein